MELSESGVCSTVRVIIVVIIIIIIIIIILMGAFWFISIFPNQFKAPQGWKLWSLLPVGST